MPEQCTCYCTSCWRDREKCVCPTGPRGEPSSSCPVDGYLV